MADEKNEPQVMDALEYERVLRSIEKLKTGTDGGRGSMDGTAEASYWRTLQDFEESADSNINTDLADIIDTISNLAYVLTGIMKSLDILREKIEKLEGKI